MATTNSTIEKIAPMFTDLLIKKIECLKTDWQKPWIASLEQGLPRETEICFYNSIHRNYIKNLIYLFFILSLPFFLLFIVSFYNILHQPVTYDIVGIKFHESDALDVFQDFESMNEARISTPG